MFTKDAYVTLHLRVACKEAYRKNLNCTKGVHSDAQCFNHTIAKDSVGFINIIVASNVRDDKMHYMSFLKYIIPHDVKGVHVSFEFLELNQS